MEELFLETNSGLIPLKEEQIQKYNLKMGTYAPFTKFRIVDKHGRFGSIPFENKTSSPGVNDMPLGEGMDDDEIVEFEDLGSIMSQSEIIDFGRGTDSSNY